MENISININIDLFDLNKQIKSRLEFNPSIDIIIGVRNFLLDLSSALDDAIEKSEIKDVKDIPKIKKKVKTIDYTEMVKKIDAYFKERLDIEILGSSRVTMKNESCFKHLLRYYLNQWLTPKQIGLFLGKDRTTIVASTEAAKGLYFVKDPKLLNALEEFNKCLDFLGYPKLYIHP